MCLLAGGGDDEFSGEYCCVDLLLTGGGGDVLSGEWLLVLFPFPFPLCLGVEVRGMRDLLISSKLMGAKININYAIIFVHSLEIMQNN